MRQVFFVVHGFVSILKVSQTYTRIDRNCWIVIFQGSSLAPCKAEFQLKTNIGMDKWTYKTSCHGIIACSPRKPRIFLRIRRKSYTLHIYSIGKHVYPFAILTRCNSGVSGSQNGRTSTPPIWMTHPSINFSIKYSEIARE